ncbi:MAG: amidohydrolase [Saprospiraceae bacterium]|nr:amidohydrolase [Saprospiraceae bacterium]
MRFNRRQFLQLMGPAAAGLLVKTGPNTIIHNATIHTVDPTQPKAQAIALFGDRILATGSNEEVLKLATSFTQKIDLQGLTVLPGFIDAHSHPGYSGRMHLIDVDCSLDSIAKIKAAIGQRAKETGAGEWVFGFKYDDTKTAESRYINRQDLDDIAPNHPVIITHRGGHTAFVNSMAYQVAGVDENTPDPNGGHFDRDKVTGKLTGRILETATDYFDKHRPKITDEMNVDAVELISEMLAKQGITSVHDAGGSPWDLEAYHAAHEQGRLKTRVYCHIRGLGIYKLMEAGIKTGFGNDWVKVGPLKTAIDGSISERTARLSKPYIGSDDDYGILTSTPEALYEICRDAHEGGWQIGVHANGDVGIELTLDVFERLQKEMPKRDPRFRLEHCTVVNDELVKRIAKLNAIPCPFSTYVYWHSEKMKFYGEERLNNMFALRSFLDAGIKVTQTSDYPPGPFEPMMAIQSSVTRVGYDGQLWGANQKITVEEAIMIGTIHGAYASYEENEKGSLQPGKLADLVVLGNDPKQVDPMEIINIPILKTMVGGDWVYES